MKTLLALAAAFSLLAGVAHAQGTGMRPGITRPIISGATDTATAADYLGWIAWKSATASAKTETLPACSASINGMWIGVADAQNTGSLYNITVNAASGNVGGSSGGFVITSNLGAAIFNCDGAGTNWIVSAQFAPGANVRAVTGTTDTILSTDNGGLVTYNNSSPVAVSLPQAGSVTFPSNSFFLAVRNYGAGTVTITPTTSTINNGASSLALTQNQSALIYSDGSANYQAITIGTGTSIATHYTGTTSGGPTAYTASTVQPSGFTLSPYFRVCLQFSTANGPGATLAVSGTAALPMQKQIDAGLVAFAGGEIPGGTQASEQCFMANSSVTAWILQTDIAGGTTQDIAGHAVSVSEWTACHSFVFTTVQTLTLPASNTLGTNGCVMVQTIGVALTVALANSSDGIVTTNLTPTAGASAILPPGITTQITTTASLSATSFRMPTGPQFHFDVSWTIGQNLSNSPTSANGVDIPISREGGVPIVITGVVCRPELLVGGVATIDICAAPSGTPLSTGGTCNIKINTNPCNANSGATVDFNMGVTNAAIPAGNWVGIHAAGAGFATSAGSGAIQISYIKQ